MRKKLDIKKLALLNLPYVFAFYFVDKLATVFRLAPGTESMNSVPGARRKTVASLSTKEKANT